MLPLGLQNAVQTSLSEHLGKPVKLEATEAIGGGCIHHAHRLKTSAGDFFIKFNHLKEAANFQAELKGLQLLDQAGALRVPKTISTGETASHAFFLMEYIPTGPRGARFWQEFGTGLAALHQNSAEAYGLDHPNFIGRLPQSNAWIADWTTFFIEERLEAQVQLAEQNNYARSELRRQFERLYPRLESLMPDEPPSLLHGDLWSGNFMTDDQGKPVIIDPAVYYGHREIEIAFTRLFGGFSTDFYEAYNEAWPLEAGWQDRIDLFNLYPLAVHLNLFGTGYLPEIQSILRRFI